MVKEREIAPSCASLYEPSTSASADPIPEGSLWLRSAAVSAAHNSSTAPQSTPVVSFAVEEERGRAARVKTRPRSSLAGPAGRCFVRRAAASSPEIEARARARRARRKEGAEPRVA